MSRIKTLHVLVGYWLLAVALALLLPQSLAAPSQSAAYLPPLFDSLSARSIEPGLWRTYFIVMMAAGLLALPPLAYTTWKELGTPKVSSVLPLAATMFIAGAAILLWLLNIDLPLGRPLPKFGAMLESRFGLAALGSLFLVGVLAIVHATLVVPLIATAKRYGSGRMRGKAA